jgi:hypothetical protein
MEFRAPSVAAERNAGAIAYLTKDLKAPEAGRRTVERLIDRLGNSVRIYPHWHPILTAPQQDDGAQVTSMADVKIYGLCDHTIEFVRGFVTCPYSDKRADELVEAIEDVQGLYAYRLDEPLYQEGTFPVVVYAHEIELEADGTIRSRDAIALFAQQIVKNAQRAQVGETWWNMRSLILGQPHGSRSSLFVNQHAGLHMRKILEALNNSGMFGPVLEDSLDMLSQTKRDAINELLLRTALKNWDKQRREFEFELRGEICKAGIRDTWDDGMELSIRVAIGKNALFVSGFYEAATDRLTYQEPRGKRAVAVKFA